MKNRLFQYLIAVIICLGAGRTFFHHFPAQATHPTPLETSCKMPLQRLQEHNHAVITDANTHRPSLPCHLPVSEKEEPDDENETPALNSEQVPWAIYFEMTVARRPLPFHRITVIPLFLLLHSWRHYLSA